MISLKHTYTEPGFCQTHFKTKNESGSEIYYCLMEEGIGKNTDVYLYRTSSDGEADYRVSIKDGCKVDFENPADEYGRSLLARYMEKFPEKITLI